MTDDQMQAVMTTWVAKGLPARLDVAATAKLLGFAESNIQVLMAASKLTPLGDPASNAPKWFAAVEMIRLAADQDWLHKATKEIALQNSFRAFLTPSSRMSCRNRGWE
jgi:hypothetical protein